jgi:hypothetical protein
MSLAGIVICIVSFAPADSLPLHPSLPLQLLLLLQPLEPLQLCFALFVLLVFFFASLVEDPATAEPLRMPAIAAPTIIFAIDAFI